MCSTSASQTIEAINFHHLESERGDYNTCTSHLFFQLQTNDLPLLRNAALVMIVR